MSITVQNRDPRTFSGPSDLSTRSSLCPPRSGPMNVCLHLTYIPFHLQGKDAALFLDPSFSSVTMLDEGLVVRSREG